MRARDAVLIAVLGACTPKSPPPPPVSAPAPSRPTTGTAPAWFVGAWKREWIKGGTSAPTESRIVRDLQTPSIFGSVRIPLDRPDLSSVQSFAELTSAQIAELAKQGGFAGTARFDGDVATWTHEIDFQPPRGVDTARLERASPSSVLERGLDGSFSELWWSMSSGDGKYLGIRIVRAGRTERVLTVVGDHFVYARNRARDLPAGKSLPELVAATPDRAQLAELLDCELSYGLVRGGRVPWEVRYSTLPWREGKPMELAAEIAIDAAGTPGPRAATPDLEWHVEVNTFSKDDLRLLFL